MTSGRTTARAGENRHLWWALSPAYTMGVIAFIPVLHAAIALRRPQLWYAAAGLVAGDVVAWSLLNGETDGPAGDAGVVLALVLAVTGTVQAFALRGEVFGTDPAMGSRRLVGHQDPVVAQALAARQRRAEARSLAGRDPALARDLLIGRPDLPRHYNDGGLVDINHAPAAVLSTWLGVALEQAQAIVEVRERLGRFESADDLGSFADLPPRTIDELRDRIIAL